MKFHKNNRRRAVVYEKDLIDYWRANKTFTKSVSQRPSTNPYIFYDGPPFITGVPHAGTLLSSIAKDVVARYYTMQGQRVERVWGWDCHGLPAEVFTEKKLGIIDRRDIGTKISLEEYINTCRANMVQTGSDWEDTIDRIGRWVDFKGAYKTMDINYMESVWWAFKTLYEKGKIYEGEKVLLYCVRDATPISRAEVAMDNSYQDVTDPSVYVKLKLVGQDRSLLAWTTTPWTLPANTAAAVNKDAEYADVKVGDETFVIATSMVQKALQDEKHNVVEHTVLRTFKGGELVNLDYEPLFENRGNNAHKVWHADYVEAGGDGEGTGIVHLAPAYGEEDYDLAKQQGFPFILNLDENGFYDSGEWQGQQVWEANKQIAKTLLERGVVYRIEYIRHSYPHCHRCGTKLIYRAHPSWFMDIDGQRQQMIDANADISWFPAHIKTGRFAKTMESAPDWNLSRDRFWATAMPVWKGTDNSGKEHIKVVGSYEELKELSGVVLEDYHRPWIDDVKFTINDIEYTRIDKVMDCWFESGSMPFAQFHYPFENKIKFEQSYPCDFIVEYVGQVRAWFYYLHAVNIGLFGKPAFKNVNVTGVLAGNDGRKMSKSFGNFTDPNELMDKYSADSFRFLLMSTPVMNGEDFALQDKEVADVARKLTMIWNMYDFFTLYSDVDQWDSATALHASDPNKLILLDPTTQSNPLDSWILSRLHQTTAEVTQHMNAYNLPAALKPILPLIEDASNWYVRRSRKRFWKSDNDGDKAAAYQTLHYVLVHLSYLLAPFTPFLAEELYRQLTGGESVHLLDYPKPGIVHQPVLTDMAQMRELITVGLSQRAEVGIKVRQPLGGATITRATDFASTLDQTFYEQMLCEELNLKSVTISVEAGSDPTITIDTDLTPDLRREGLMREVVRHVQQARKQSGLQVDDRITLALVSTDPELTALMADKSLTDQISQETLATTLLSDLAPDMTHSEVQVEGTPLTIGILAV